MGFTSETAHTRGTWTPAKAAEMTRKSAAARRERVAFAERIRLETLALSSSLAAPAAERVEALLSQAVTQAAKCKGSHLATRLLTQAKLASAILRDLRSGSDTPASVPAKPRLSTLD